MAVSMPKVDYMKIAVVVLLLADLGAAYPLYEKIMEDPLADMKIEESRGTGGIDLRDAADGEDTAAITTGFPPGKLLSWDPFQSPKIEKPGSGGDSEGVDSGEVPVQVVLPIPTDEFTILGIISLNGEYLALVSTAENPSAEVRRGQIIPGTEDIRAAQITAKGIMLTKPGAERTFLPLTQPGLEGKPWFAGDIDTSSIRGSIQIQSGSRRRR